MYSVECRTYNSWGKHYFQRYHHNYYADSMFSDRMEFTHDYIANSDREKCFHLNALKDQSEDITTRVGTALS